MPRPPRQNTPAEIEAFDQVCERLAGFDGLLVAERVDGYMTAVAAGPLAPVLDEWLPAMAGDAFERSFADPEDRARGERVLQARMAVLLDQLDAETLFDEPDALRLAPLMEEWDDAARAELRERSGFSEAEAAEFVTGGLWADGFFAALDDHKDRWIAKPDDEQAALFEDLLRQVNALRLAEGSDELKQHIAEVYGEGETPDRDRLVDEACYAVQDLRCWWVDQAPRPETRRVEKTPGRNDPCPCGSGKKFKKCHGAG